MSMDPIKKEIAQKLIALNTNGGSWNIEGTIVFLSLMGRSCAEGGEGEDKESNR